VDLEHRTSAPAHATGAVEFVRLDEIAEDSRFQLREPGEVSDLATSLGRLGQLDPVELRLRPEAAEGEPRWQVVAGFRRIAALRLLQRDRVLARLHDHLADEDAWALALSQALLTEPLGAMELEALREKLRPAGAAWADELIDEAQVRAPVAPELRERFHAFLRQPRPVEEDAGAEPVPGEDGGTIEMTPEELAEDLSVRLYEVNQDLAAAYEAWPDLPAEGRRQILEQARYVAEILQHLESEAE
jgi:ParB family transcriptional regulator, chromosome partitioning protein